ncbi:MAG: bifunctional 5,10-methylenetetrahydrofolate dehydrogenase/5,10-methenyltetrahydrofolate cyclohydrolase [Chloroflexi bacterium]|nr:bifunctional 5,10-methylenetetrahydrofolate dehydrogenase/5,10-methenyltetrahydrofolate cyclohydrolase [Chloroflexota bacterium]
MTAQLLDGRALSSAMRKELDAEIAAIKAELGVTPKIAVVRAGEDPASVSYANAIQRTCELRKLAFEMHALPEEVGEAELLSRVVRLNEDPGVHGIMIQEPLPKGIRAEVITDALSPAKDIDGVHPANTGRLAQAEPVGRSAGVSDFFVPATPAGGLELLKRHGVALNGKLAVIVGRSRIVGKPMAMLLLRENATVILCHSRTADLPAICRQADILCAAVGRAKMITADWVKPGAVVVDFGVNFQNEVMVGDVDFEGVQEVASMITPVPGGTGPMTNVMLLKNLLEAARRQGQK